MEDRCVCCGEIVPEGRMICPICASIPLKGKLIRFKTADELIEAMIALNAECIDTDFYHDDPDHKYVLEIK